MRFMVLRDFRYIFSGSFGESIADIFGIIAIIIIVSVGLHIPGF